MDWCDMSAVNMVGVFGSISLLMGLVQLGAGVYFMLTLPIFGLASNIWTGISSGICGSVTLFLSCTEQARRRRYVILVLSISSLVANVINVVIIQIGEYSIFLSEEDLRKLDDENMHIQFKIAIWMTTISTALAIGASYITAQYLFCILVRGPRRYKGRLAVVGNLTEESVQQRSAEGNGRRFFPPSRIVRSPQRSKVEKKSSFPGSFWIPRMIRNSFEKNDNGDGIGDGYDNGGGGIINDEYSDGIVSIKMGKGRKKQREGRKNDDSQSGLDKIVIVNDNDLGDKRFETFRPSAIYGKNFRLSEAFRSGDDKTGGYSRFGFDADEVIAEENDAGIPKFLKKRPDMWFLASDHSSEPNDAKNDDGEKDQNLPTGDSKSNRKVQVECEVTVHVSEKDLIVDKVENSNGSCADLGLETHISCGKKTNLIDNEETSEINIPAASNGECSASMKELMNSIEESEQEIRLILSSFSEDVPDIVDGMKPTPDKSRDENNIIKDEGKVDRILENVDNTNITTSNTSIITNEFSAKESIEKQISNTDNLEIKFGTEISTIEEGLTRKNSDKDKLLDDDDDDDDDDNDSKQKPSIIFKGRETLLRRNTSKRLKRPVQPPPKPPLPPKPKMI